MLAEGLTALEIANPLFISLERVPSHRRNLMRRLGLRNKVELIRLAIEHKIEGVR
ncbi:helix-turn-helix domain-containing protein [Thiorhodovibrio winogradskyi]|uniref:helix-turn-helix domain-containing protein n=1 Tax=Thiorhodovibrio winogradskyi TaxID=77007 RepID=UPI0019123A53